MRRALMLLNLHGREVKPNFMIMMVYSQKPLPPNILPGSVTGLSKSRHVGPPTHNSSDSPFYDAFVYSVCSVILIFCFDQ